MVKLDDVIIDYESYDLLLSFLDTTHNLRVVSFETAQRLFRIMENKFEQPYGRCSGCDYRNEDCQCMYDRDSYFDPMDYKDYHDDE
jgi:hypothetical protein